MNLNSTLHHKLLIYQERPFFTIHRFQLLYTIYKLQEFDTNRIQLHQWINQVINRSFASQKIRPAFSSNILRKAIFSHDKEYRSHWILGA